MKKVQAKNFKQCSKCLQKWKTRHEFVNDSQIQIIGYQVNFRKLESGFFLFNHFCGATMAIQVSVFADMYEGKVFQVNKTGSDECPEYCLHQDSLESCPASCECAFVREIIQILKK